MVLIANITPPAEGLIYTSNNLKLKIADKVIGNGTLYISQSSLSWVPDDKPEGISIMWKQISVHGISSHPVKCVYFMLDHHLIWDGVYDGLANGNVNGNGPVAGLPMEHHNDIDDVEEDEGNATDEEDPMTECWLIPSDISTVDTIFQAMTDCQALHPDSNDSISEESDFMDDEDADDDNYVDAIGPAAAAENIEAAVDADARGGMENLNINDDRFNDADD